MFDVMADWLTVPLLHHEGGKTPRRVGLAHPSIAPYGVFTTKDGTAILISIQSEREWASLCRDFLQNESAIKDERFASNVVRVRNREQTDTMVGAVFASLDAVTAEQRLTRADVAFAKVNDMAALAAHPHLRRITVETASGNVSYPAPAPIFTGAPRRYGAVPALGAHQALEDDNRCGQDL
jgi:itaconate CoA-transferase